MVFSMLVKRFLKKIIPASYSRVDKLSEQILEIRDFVRFSEIRYEAQKAHRKVFSDYRNCLAGKDVAILGTGPSLDRFIPIKECIYMGVNSAILFDKVHLDFHFMQDYNENLMRSMLRFKGSRTKFFFGMHYLDWIKNIPLKTVEDFNAGQYFFYDCLLTKFFPYDFTLDISENPFILYYSTIFIPLQFALWTHPARIYVVGCDCSENGHFTSNAQKYNLGKNHLAGIISGWKKFKKFVQKFYPDIEIISVNPVGLKGLFTDLYTDSNEVPLDKNVQGGGII